MGMGSLATGIPAPFIPWNCTRISLQHTRDHSLPAVMRSDSCPHRPKDCRATCPARDATVVGIRAPTEIFLTTYPHPDRPPDNTATMDYRYTCVSPCQEQWNRSGPYNRHQRSCKHWRAHQDKMRKLRVEADAQPRKKRRKLLSKKV